MEFELLKSNFPVGKEIKTKRATPSKESRPKKFKVDGQLVIRQVDSSQSRLELAFRPNVRIPERREVMDSELLELQKLFEATQEAKATVRLSERNVVELVSKLQELQLLDSDLLHSVDGKEYITKVSDSSLHLPTDCPQFTME